MVTLKNISKTYYLTKTNKVEALKDVDLEIKAGEFVSIVGPSGSGKSTLLNMIGLLDVPDKNQGTLMINQHNIADLNKRELADTRRESIGFIFQTFNLMPKLSAFENVLLPMRYAGVKRTTRKARAKELLKSVGLDRRARHRPPELSGGEKQRVAIARALVNHPEIILADEPTGNLDSQSGKEVMQILKKLNREEKVTLIVVTHDLEIAAQADRIIKMKDGGIC